MNVLEVEDLCVSYPNREGVLNRRNPLRVVDSVSFNVGAGEIVGLVGESGSGKSTVARAITRLLPIESGRVRLAGTDVTDLSFRAMRPHRRRIQMVFQDPYSSLDPSMTALDIVAESLTGIGVSGTERRKRAGETLHDVGLSEPYWGRYPHEFSGGQRQRIAIARALAPQPDLIVCDEPVSALDLSTQNQILDLLASLRETSGIGYLFISHDLSVVRWLVDRIAVMYAGQIVEEGPADVVFDSPKHPYTWALLSAVPVVDQQERSRERILLPGELPKPGRPPAGCRFHTRCPFAFEPCFSHDPETYHPSQGGRVTCHLHTDGPVLAGARVQNLHADQGRGRGEDRDIALPPIVQEDPS